MYELKTNITMQPKKVCALIILLIFPFLNSEFLVSAQSKEKPRKCIMVFGAHADDVDEIAGGTFAKYIDMGYEGIYVCITNNTAGCNLERTPYYDKGPNFTVSNATGIYPAGALESIQIREEEARQAAAVYGAIPVFLYFRETWFWQGRKECYIGSEEFYQYQPPGRQIISVATRSGKDIDFVVSLLRQYKPEIVITHTLGGEKHDHGNGAYMMYLAFKEAIEQNIPVGKLWMTVNGWLLDMPAQETGRGIPDVKIDVTNYLDTKYLALNKHVSQNGGFGRDYVTENETQPKEVIEEFITVLDNTK
jgi:LmbE family N-acetylglucosaminyl deacetylase